MNCQKQKSNLKMRLTLFVVFSIMTNFSFAQNLDLNPTPQQFISEGSIGNAN